MKTLTLVLALLGSSLASASEGYVCDLGNGADLAPITLKITEPGKLTLGLTHLGYQAAYNVSLVSDMMGVQSYDNQMPRDFGQAVLVLKNPTQSDEEPAFDAELTMHGNAKYLLKCYMTKELKADYEYQSHNPSYEALLSVLVAKPEILMELKAKFPKVMVLGIVAKPPVMENISDDRRKTTQDYSISTGLISGDIMGKGPTVSIHRETISFAYGVLSDKVTFEFSKVAE